MSKGKLIIDLNEYCSQSEYAKTHGYRLNTISQWIKRAKEGKSKKIEYLEIPELNITLVKR